MGRPITDRRTGSVGGLCDSLDDEQERATRLLLSRPRQHSAPASRRSWLPQQADAREQSAVPAMRAITHAEGKAIRSSRRARRGAESCLTTTVGVSGRTPISSSRIAWRRASAARRPLNARACPDGRPGGGRGSLGHAQDDQGSSTVAAGLRSLSPAVAVVGTHPGRRSHLVRVRRRAGPRRDHIARPRPRAAAGTARARAEQHAGPQLLDTPSHVTQPRAPPVAEARNPRRCQRGEAHNLGGEVHPEKQAEPHRRRRHAGRDPAHRVDHETDDQQHGQQRTDQDETR